jgi:hypothetical protein
MGGRHAAGVSQRFQGAQAVARGKLCRGGHVTVCSQARRRALDAFPHSLEPKNALQPPALVRALGEWKVAGAEQQWSEVIESERELSLRRGSSWP